MKFLIVLASIAVCALAQNAHLKQELLTRAAAVDNRIKATVKQLTAEKREHLTQLLEEEEKRLETLVAELKEVPDTDAVRLAIIEDRLIDIEYRVENEVNTLQHERATQELLLSNAHILREWVTEEIKILEANTEHREQAQMAARVLRGAEVRLNEIATELVRAQDQRQIERFEVELRTIEVRLYEALRALHFTPSTGSPTAATATTAHVVTGPTSPRPTTGRTNPTHPSTTGTPQTHPTTIHPTHPTTGRPVTTPPPIHSTRAQ